MKTWKVRLLGGLFFAFLFMLVGTTSVWAGGNKGDDPPPPPIRVEDCRECHEDIYDMWEQSAHGQGLSCGQCHLSEQQDNHAREGHGAQEGPRACMSCHTTGYDLTTDTWEEDNIHCTSCHTPVPEDHPDQPAPINRSAELCGQCHIEARFEWESSTHGAVGVTCVSCHSQHETELKAGNVSDECATCHGERVEGFGHSEHSEQGLSCVDCHLAPLDAPLGKGVAKRNHSFHVELSTCTSCHAYEMHDERATPVASVDSQLEPPGPADSMASSISFEVSTVPPPVNPLALALVMGTLGFFGGIIVAPVLGQWYRRLREEHKRRD
ncbi:MAG: hypothetical protein GXP40_00905 [Chloroflexi bacterium]|nr:hypothetical protein [Chloroflexota bacterium]